MLLGNLRGIGVHVSRVDSPDAATEDAITNLVPADEARVGEIPRGFHGGFISILVWAIRFTCFFCSQAFTPRERTLTGGCGTSAPTPRDGRWRGTSNTRV